MTDQTISELKQKRDAIRQTEKHLRARDLAARMGISEAELVMLDVGESVTPLKPEWAKIVGAVPSLGPVMALTRNESVVHERVGTYGTLELTGHVGLILGEDIDLRIFFSHWASGFAAVEPGQDKTRRSLQFFDHQGTAVHKIYLTDDSNVAAFEKIVADFAAPPAPLKIVPPAPSKAVKSDDQVDVAGFRNAWDALKDTHEFHGLLMRFGVDRVQGLRLAGGKRAWQVPNTALRDVLIAARDQSMPIMVFVGSAGVIQIHTGPVQRLEAMGPWYNVLDKSFNLHLREDRIATSWIVAKPTTDGMVTSLELFDADGGGIATLFGKRKPGQPELNEWRVVLDSLSPREAA